MIALVTGLTPLACFESGPLGTSEVDTAPALPDTAGSVDANPQPTDTSTVGPDTSFPPPDTGEPVDIGEPVDTGEPDTVDTADTDAPDTVDTADTDTADAVDTVDTDAADTADTADASTARPCLTVDDCDGVVGPGDLCGGVIGCVDYRCVVDPATVVTCPATGDPCLESTCEPATGICVTVDVCVCTPVGPLACATPVTYQTGAAGETSVVSGYSCPGASGYGGGPERVFTFDVATSQRVRVSAESAGVSAIFVVPRDAQGDCLPGACVAGGPVALFDAVGGTSYAVVVEHSFGGQAVTLRADCDITSETWCNDGLDDDGDGLTDCDDPDCSGVDPCPAQPTSEAGFCFDGIDNDGDGLTDCDDPDCWVEPVCLQSCSVTSVSVMCGFTQGASTGGGQTRMQDYSCHPTPAPGKEIVYRFVPPSSGPVTVTMSSGAPLALYLLADQGYGCTPRHCIAYGPTIVQFDAVFGTTYYVAIDAPAGVSGQYNIALQCDL